MVSPVNQLRSPNVARHASMRDSEGNKASFGMTGKGGAAGPVKDEW